MKIIGHIVGINGQVAQVEFKENFPKLHELLVLEKNPHIQFEVYSSSQNHRFYCFILVDSSEIKQGDKVIGTGECLQIAVGKKILGKAIDIFGTAHNDPTWQADAFRPIFSDSFLPLEDVQLHTKLMMTGIKALDFFSPMLAGGKMGLFGGAGVGKTILLTELMNNVVVKNHHQTKNDFVSVFGAVGERSREAQELIESLQDAKVLDKTAIIIGQMGENPSIRFRTAFAAARVAEYFRDEQQTDVLFFLDNMYRFAQAGYELSTLMHQIPSEDGYQPTLPSEIGELHERLSSSHQASISSIEAIFVPSDDLSDYAIKTSFSYFDTTVVLSRDIYQQGRYPAIDILQSNSVALNPEIVGEKHYELFLASKKTLETARSLDRIVSLIGEEELSPSDRATYKRAQLIKNYMTQKFHVVAQQTNQPGDFIKLNQVLDDMEQILAGKYDDLAPEKFLYIAAIET